jgi:hypothetical protein
MKRSTWMVSLAALAVFAACGGGGGSAASTTASGSGTSTGGTVLTQGRHTTDQPDDVTGAQVHVMYVVPSGASDRQLDLGDTLINSIASYNNWLATQTGGRKLRYDTLNGRLDITYVSLPRTDAQYQSFGARQRDTIEADLQAAGLLAAGKIYSVYYEGGSPNACADAPRPPDLPGQVNVMYLHGLAGVAGVTPCDQNQFAASASAPAGYLDLSMMHEIVHTLGGVSDGAPNQVLSGHVNTSPTDLMYAGPLPWQPSVLDVNKSNYYNPAGLPAGIFNLANSDFLLPAP